MRNMPINSSVYWKRMPKALCLDDGVSFSVVSGIGWGLRAACSNANAGIEIGEDETRSCEAVLDRLFLHRSVLW